MNSFTAGSPISLIGNGQQSIRTVAIHVPPGSFGAALRPRISGFQKSIPSHQKPVSEFDQRLAERVQRLEKENLRLSGENQKLTEQLAKVVSGQLKASAEQKALGVARSKASADSNKPTIEKRRCEQDLEEVTGQFETTSNRLAAALSKLEYVEQRISRLKDLETELEKSVVRSQRCELSRRGLYNSEEDDWSPGKAKLERDFCRQLIDRLDFFDGIINQFRSRSKTVAQLNLLKDSFTKLLAVHSVDSFDFDPGTELTREIRSKIILIAPDDIDEGSFKKEARQSGELGKPTVLRTIKPGYFYTESGRRVVIRKAEVVLAS